MMADRTRIKAINGWTKGCITDDDYMIEKLRGDLDATKKLYTDFCDFMSSLGWINAIPLVIGCMVFGCADVCTCVIVPFRMVASNRE